MPQHSTSYAGAIGDTIKSFWHGLSITLSYLVRRPMTVQYPDRTPYPVREMLPPRYRGFLEVDVDICTGCQACERACPISCIQIELEKDPANPKQRVVTQFDIDEAKCMFCGLCVEPCPTGSIQHTREFEATQRSVRNLVFRWADPLKPFPVYKVVKGAPYIPRAPLGALVREVIARRQWDAPGVAYLPPETLKAPPPPAPKPPPAAKPPAAKPAEGAAPAAPKPAPAAAAAPAAPASVPAAPAAPAAEPAPAAPASGSGEPKP
jgi:NADH-quinone oxidoreductase subunit I/NAD(P)H-quinone oxidoreductase subunit I